MYLLKLFSSPKREQAGGGWGGAGSLRSASLITVPFPSQVLEKDFRESLIISLVLISIIVSLPDSFLAQPRE